MFQLPKNFWFLFKDKIICQFRAQPLGLCFQPCLCSNNYDGADSAACALTHIAACCSTARDLSPGSDSLQLCYHLSLVPLSCSLSLRVLVYISPPFCCLAVWFYTFLFGCIAFCPGLTHRLDILLFASKCMASNV